MLREAFSQRRWKNHARRDGGDGDDWDMASLHLIYQHWSHKLDAGLAGLDPVY